MGDIKPSIVMVVDDEPDLVELLCFNLQRENYATISATTGEQAATLATTTPPDLILLDLMLPGVSGIDLCRQFKKNPLTATIPILMLTAKGEEGDIVTGLNAGADDYVVKPFSVAVLMARVGALLRRGKENGTEVWPLIELDELSIDRDRRIVSCQGVPVSLTFTEYAILDALVEKKGSVMTRAGIVKAIRDGAVSVTDRSIDVHVTSLRKKLGVCGEKILTVRGVGYRFDL
jgi:two-component system phosphate regulon response regulator PhoB